MTYVLDVGKQNIYTIYLPRLRIHLNAPVQPLRTTLLQPCSTRNLNRPAQSQHLHTPMYNLWLLHRPVQPLLHNILYCTTSAPQHPVLYNLCSSTSCTVQTLLLNNPVQLCSATSRYNLCSTTSLYNFCSSTSLYNLWLQPHCTVQLCSSTSLYKISFSSFIYNLCSSIFLHNLCSSTSLYNLCSPLLHSLTTSSCHHHFSGWQD